MEPTPIVVSAEVKREQIRDKAIKSIQETFPLKTKNYQLEVADVRVDAKDYSPVDHKNALLQAKTLSESVKGTVLLKDTAGKVVQKVPNFTFAQLPYLTQHHTFVIDGNSYNVTNQLRMKPGVYTRKRRNAELESFFNLARGENFRLSMDPAKGFFNIELGASKVPLYPVLNKLGVPDQEITKFWNKELVDVNREAFLANADKHMASLQKKVMYNPTADPVADIRRALDNTVLDPKVTQKTLGKPYEKVTPETILAASKKLLAAHQEPLDFDERDNLAFKHLKSVDDFIAERIKLEGRALKFKAANRLDRSGDIEASIPRSAFTKSIHQFLTTSSLSNNPSQINPVELMDNAARVTSLGEGGISTERAIPAEARRLHFSHLGVLDPVRTSESSRVGIDLRTSIFTGRDRDGNIYSVMRDKKGQHRWVPVDELVDKTVAFSNQPKEGKVDAIRNGRIQSVPSSEIDYRVPVPHAMYSPSTTLIPFIENMDGNRQEMTSKMLTQALPLVNGEPPFVQVASYVKGSTMERDVAKHAGLPHAPVSGTITRIKDGYVYIKPEKPGKHAAEDVRVPFYENFPLAAKTYIHHDLLVKPGDKVKAGASLAQAAHVKDGTMALGRNLRVAYMPYYGLNTNDALVVSESAAKKLTSAHMFRLGTDLDVDTKTSVGAHQSYFGNKYTNDHYHGLDQNGVIKPGTQVKKGDILVAAVQTTKASPEAQMLGKLHKSLVRPYRDASVVWDRDFPGTVTDVAHTGKKIRFTVKTEEPVQVGDKIVGRAAGKGVVSTIVPDEQMIKDEQGRTVDLLVSPTSVLTRLNPSQILETALGKVAEKTGKPIVIDNFSGRNNLEWVREELKKHGLKDTETVFDPVSGKKIPKVLVGRQFIMKLFKSTDTNYSARGVEDYDVNQQPSGGGIKGSKAVGKMEFNALVAHGAKNILRETSVLKSQKNDEFWRAYQLGLPPPALKTTFAYDKFGAMLTGSGIKMQKRENFISLGPLTDQDIDKMSAGEVKNPLHVRAKDLKPESGGLFDPLITGGNSGQKWSHFSLAEPIVNPIFEKPVKSLLGLTANDFGKIMKEEGGAGFQKRLSAIDVDKKIGDLEKEIETAKADQRDKIIKQLKALRALKEAGLSPEKAYVISKVPIVPPVFRPVLLGKTGNLQVSDANYLYRDSMLANEQLKTHQATTPDLAGEARKHLYHSVGALYGLRETETPQLKNRGVQGFISRLAGQEGPKHGYFMSKLVGKKQDLAGRGTMVPDPSLAMDEIGLPDEMCWEMYSPHVIRSLVQKGYSALDARKMVKDRNPTAREALMVELKDKPVIVNRAPTLYRYNMIAAYPKPVPGKTIRVHELLPPIQAGDYDGDAINIHAPVLPAAVAEARRMTLPNMLLSDQQKFTLTKAAPQHEAVIGVYLASSAEAEGKPKTFKSQAEAQAAYNRGEIGLDTPVEIKP